MHPNDLPPDRTQPRCQHPKARPDQQPFSRECRRWFDSVHSRNSIRATISGLTQTHLSISAAVNPSPQRPLCLSGRLTNGHFEMIKRLSLANTWSLEAGTKLFKIQQKNGGGGGSRTPVRKALRPEAYMLSSIRFGSPAAVRMSKKRSRLVR